MKITLKDTKRIEVMDNLQLRVWEGITSEGIKCRAYIACLSIDEEQNHDVFNLDMQDIKNQPFIEGIIF